MSDSEKVTWGEQNVVNVFVKGISMQTETGLKENDSDRSAEPNQKQSQERENSDSE